MPKVGDKINFTPACWQDGVALGMARSISGRISYVNEKHRYYTAEGQCGKYIVRESYKF